jgi:hypothetical protein
LKEGGHYIIEDWGWLHWDGFEIPAHWNHSQPLTNLVLELIMLCASNPEFITEVNVMPSMVIVKKGKQQIKGDFVLVNYIRNYISINQTKWDEADTRLRIQLDETLTQLKRSKDEIDRIYSSKSWNLTKPLRAFRRLIGVPSGDD